MAQVGRLFRSDALRNNRFLLVLAWLVISCQSVLAQVTYTYIGNKFNLFSCGGDLLCSTVNPATTSYTTNDFVTATLTLGTALPGNLSLHDLRGLPGFSLTMYDGHQKMTLDPPVPGEAIVSTDASGKIIGPWSVFVNCCFYPNNNIFALNYPNVRGVGDGAALTAPTGSYPNTPRNQGMIFASPGVWIGGTVLSADDPVYGPGSITRDTATGLDWLDLPFTQNWTVANVTSQFGVGGQFPGFRYATSAEVNQLYTDAGIPAVEQAFATITPSARNVPSVPQLMFKWGITGSTPSVPSSNAYVADGPGLSGYYTSILSYSPAADAASASPRGSSAGGAAFSFVGHALVRPTSPAATAAALISQINLLTTSGVLAADQSAGLIDKLNAMISSINRGNTNAACGQVNAFLNQVDSLVRTGRLSASIADQLKASVTRISDAVGC